MLVSDQVGPRKKLRETKILPLRACPEYVGGHSLFITASCSCNGFTNSQIRILTKTLAIPFLSSKILEIKSYFLLGVPLPVYGWYYVKI